MKALNLCLGALCILFIGGLGIPHLTQPPAPALQEADSLILPLVLTPGSESLDHSLNLNQEEAQFCDHACGPEPAFIPKEDNPAYQSLMEEIQDLKESLGLELQEVPAHPYPEPLHLP